MMIFKLSIIQRFIILKNYSNELRSNQISFQEAKKALKNDIKMYFYLVKKFEKDSDENFSFAKSHQVNLCFMMNFVMNSIGKEKNSMANSMANSSFTRDSNMKFNSKMNKIKLNKLFQEYKNIFKEELSKKLSSSHAIDQVINIDDHNSTNKNIYLLSIQ